MDAISRVTMKAAWWGRSLSAEPVKRAGSIRKARATAGDRRWTAPMSRYSRCVNLRALVQGSDVAKVICLVVVILFVLVCGVHLAGAHHDGDGDGLGLADRFSAIVLAMALLIGIAVTVTERSISGTLATFGSLFGLRRFGPPTPRTAVPLRR
jgi:hypothetical protein